MLAAALAGQVPAAPGTLAAAAATLTVSNPTNVVLLENMVSCGTIRDEQEKKEVRVGRLGGGVGERRWTQGDCAQRKALGRVWMLRPAGGFRVLVYVAVMRCVRVAEKK